MEPLFLKPSQISSWWSIVGGRSRVIVSVLAQFVDVHNQTNPQSYELRLKIICKKENA
jgi:hypothetical protein